MELGLSDTKQIYNGVDVHVGDEHRSCDTVTPNLKNFVVRWTIRTTKVPNLQV